MINEWILELDESKGCENKIVQLYAKKDGYYVRFALRHKETGEMKLSHIPLRIIEECAEA